MKKLIDNHFTIFSITFAILTGAGLIVWAEKYKGIETIYEILKGNRSAVYGAFASIFGSLLGFVITATSIVLGLSTSERLAIVRNSKHYPALWTSFTHTIKVLGLATVVSILALIFDKDSNPKSYIIYTAVIVVVLAVLQLSRSVWALEQVIKLIAAPAPEKKCKAE
jgi:hypothetical protein